MKYLHVRIPMMEVMPLRQADQGATLEFDAFSRDGKLIAEQGMTLTDELIERLHNFNVRKVVVTRPVERWVPESKRDSLPSGTEVIEEQAFSEASEEIIEDIQSTDSVEKMRKTALYLRRQASRAGDEQAAEHLDGLIARSHRLEEQIAGLTERLKEVEDEEAREEIMDALEGKVRQLEEAFMEISAPDSMLKETVDTVNEREGIRHSLTEFVHDNLDLVNRSHDEVEEDDGPGAVEMAEVDDELVPAIQHYNDGQSVEAVEYLLEEATETGRISTEFEDELTDLHRTLAGQRETIDQFKELLSSEVDDLEARKTLIDVLEGRKTVNRQELLELPISRSFASKTYQLVEERMEAHHQAWEMMDDAIEGELDDQIDRSQFLDRSIRKPDQTDRDEESPGQRPSLTEGDLVDVVDCLAEGNVEEGLETLERKVEDAEELGARRKAGLTMVRETISDLDDKQSRLMDRVSESVADPDAKQVLVEFLQEERSFDPDTLMSLDVDVALLEDIGDFMTERNSQKQELWRTVDELSGGLLSNDTGDESEIVSEQVDRAARTLNINERTSRSWDDGEASTKQSAGSNGKPPLLDLVEDGEPYDIANRTGIDISEVKAARQLLVTPGGMDGDQRILFEPLARENKKMFYGRKADEDGLRDSMKSISAELEQENQPYKLMMEPPDGDRYILTHGLNTTMVTVLLSHHFELSESEMLDVTAASLASDLGMVTIPPALWLKDGDLTQRGEKEVHKHPKISDDIVGDVFNQDEVIGDLVGQHHERLDGSGYPEFIEKEHQHPLAPLVAAADAYTAMVEPRPHRGKQPPNKALISMLRSKGQFDRAVVKGLVEKIGIFPNGSVALLEDARLALVHSQNPDHPLKPDVLLLTDDNRNRLDDPIPVDLTDSSAPSVSKLVRY